MPIVPDGEELDRGAPQNAGREQPREHRQHQYVTERIGDRDRSLNPGHVGGLGDWA